MGGRALSRSGIRGRKSGEGVAINSAGVSPTMARLFEGAQRGKKGGLGTIGELVLARRLHRKDTPASGSRLREKQGFFVGGHGRVHREQTACPRSNSQIRGGIRLT